MSHIGSTAHVSPAAPIAAAVAAFRDGRFVMSAISVGSVMMGHCPLAVVALQIAQYGNKIVAGRVERRLVGERSPYRVLPGGVFGLSLIGRHVWLKAAIKGPGGGELGWRWIEPDLLPSKIYEKGGDIIGFQRSYFTGKICEKEKEKKH